MSSEKSKNKTNKVDRVPPALREILKYDVYCTEKFTLWGNKHLPFKQMQFYYKVLEGSCHGIPWLVLWIAFVWLFNTPWLTQLQVNMLLGLYFDVILVCTLKAITRRRRPVANIHDAVAEYGVDKFSFPSGHASRAVYVTYIFAIVYPFPAYLQPALFTWCICVCVSRVLLNRHHILDVGCGIAVGLFNGFVISCVWLGEPTCFWIMSFINDEKVEGGEYHV